MKAAINKIFLVIIISYLIIFTSCSAGKRIFELPAIISDHMVLQQNHEVVLWGNAHPGSKVKVTASWQKQIETTTADDSTWTIRLETPEAGGPFSLTFINGDTSVVISDVMLGEVWMCSGQSNMEMPVMGLSANDSICNSRYEIAEADYPKIRMFSVAKDFSATPRKVCSGNWKVCSPETAGMYSATSYFFGKYLHGILGVPIGLIHSSWGGTMIESWMTREKLSTFEEYQQVFQSLDSIEVMIDSQENWLKKLPEVKVDNSNKNLWADLSFNDEEVPGADFDDKNWKSMNLPQTFERSPIGPFDGAVWYRRTVSIPEKWHGMDLILELGPVDDMDETWFNGQLIGECVEDGNWHKERKYTIQSTNVIAGDNIVAVRVLDVRGNGGIYGSEEKMKVYPASNPDDAISLKGQWKYLPVAVIHNGNFKLLDIASREYRNRPKLPVELGPNTPTLLYNAMINPVIPYTIKGTIWYQGESNSGSPELYSRLFPAMIECWREKWNQGNFPFYFVQIAPFNYGPWSKAAGLREAQFKTLKLPHTGMAVTLDIGNPVNIHPANKQDVGKRLALWALAKDYGKEVIYSGPLYKSMEISGDAVRIYFDHTEGGLQTGKVGLKNFQIAGDDKVFKDAVATISGNSLSVKNSGVKNAVAVRYLWDNDSEASLFNGAGMPASSFRTDSW